jgi:hypothetical protein
MPPIDMWSIVSDADALSRLSVSFAFLAFQRVSVLFRMKLGGPLVVEALEPRPGTYRILPLVDSRILDIAVALMVQYDDFFGGFVRWTYGYVGVTTTRTRCGSSPTEDWR